MAVAFCASGRKLPPFFIVEGKSVMSGWISPLKPIEVRFHSPAKVRLSAEKWYQEETVIMTAEHGCMENVSYLKLSST